MTRFLLISCLLLGACKKKEETKPAEPATAEKKVDEKAPAPEKPTEAPTMAEPAKPSGPAVTIANAAEYDAKATELTDKLLAVFVTDGKDCDKLATDLTKFGQEFGPTFEGLKAFEKENPGAEKAFDEKMKPREKEFQDKIGPSFEACQNHEGVKTAMEGLPL